MLIINFGKLVIGQSLRWQWQRQCLLYMLMMLTLTMMWRCTVLLQF